MILRLIYDLFVIFMVIVAVAIMLSDTPLRPLERFEEMKNRLFK